MPELNHSHWWGKWFPFDRATKYRMCQHSDCSAVEKVAVKS